MQSGGALIDAGAPTHLPLLRGMLVGAEHKQVRRACAGTQEGMVCHDLQQTSDFSGKHKRKLSSSVRESAYTRACMRVCVPSRAKACECCGLASAVVYCTLLHAAMCLLASLLQACCSVPVACCHVDCTPGQLAGHCSSS